MIRKIVALTVGVATGYTLAYFLGLTSFPFISVTESEFWLSKTLFICIIGFVVGGVTSLTSWKHTPGLPGMAFSLTLACIGISAISSASSTIGRHPLSYATKEEAWITATMESTLILLATLLTYSAAWLADTQIVFRKMEVKPTPKQVNSKILLTQLAPCLITTIAVAAVLRLGLAVFIGWTGKVTLLCFVISGFLASYIFKSKSTLWYSAAVPFYSASCGLVVLSLPKLTQSFALAAMPGKSWNYALIICGLGAAGSILGHWLRLATERQEKTS